MLALTLSFFILSLMFLLPALVSTCKLTSSSKKKKKTSKKMLFPSDSILKFYYQ